MTAPEVVGFGGDLHGELHRPAGGGPWPAVVWNHGSEQEPPQRPELARFYTAAGYVLFLPHRRGHGRSPGLYPIAEAQAAVSVEPAGTEARRRKVADAMIELHERYRADTDAAVEWIAGQPFVDGNRVAVSGVSHGAVQALLAASGRARSCVAFAPAAMAWRGNPEIQAWLVLGVRRAHTPIFLLQAENDYDLGPSEVLGAELAGKGGANRARVYPSYGDGAQSGHAGFACEATDSWGPDVLTFLADTM